MTRRWPLLQTDVIMGGIRVCVPETTITVFAPCGHACHEWLMACCLCRHRGIAYCPTCVERDRG